MIEPPCPWFSGKSMDDERAWFTYMICCRDGTLYTGITTDLVKRINNHNTGKNGARYTRSRRPVRLVYYEEYFSRSDAARREYRIKKMDPAAKRRLISQHSEKSLKGLNLSLAAATWNRGFSTDDSNE